MAECYSKLISTTLKNADTAKSISLLSKETGMSKSNVVRLLLDYAVEHATIITVPVYQSSIVFTK